MSRHVFSSDEQAAQSITAEWRGGLDARAFDELFRECAADVHAYVISLLGDSSAAEDVTALAFERLYRSRSRLDHGRGTPRARDDAKAIGLFAPTNPPTPLAFDHAEILDDYLRFLRTGEFPAPWSK